MIAAPGPEDGTLDIWCGTQGPVGIAEQLSEALGMQTEDVRVRTGDVGGSFGFKIFLHPEQLIIAWAARRLGRKLRWQQARSDAFLSDLHGRDNRTKARAVIDRDGKVHALAVTVHANMGSWLSNFSTYIPTLSGSRALTTNYAIETASLRVLGVMTNTPAVDAYRGAGRPEANYLMERLMDHVAAHVGIDRAEIRRRNLIRADQIPFRMVEGGTIDSGEMPELMEEALRRADYDGFAARRSESERRGMLRGFGIGMYLEQCGGGTDGGVDVRFREDGTILVIASQQENGQGHRTTLTQILSDRLGFDADGDGALTKDELLAHNRARFDRLDANDDGMISPDEFGGRLVAMFTRMDADNDGLLSGEELPRRMGRHGNHGSHSNGHHQSKPDTMAGEG